MKFSTNKDGRNTIFSDIKIFVESLFDIDDDLYRYKQKVLKYDNCFVCNIGGKNIGLTFTSKETHMLSLLNNNEPLWLIFVNEKFLEKETKEIFNTILIIYKSIFKILEIDQLNIYHQIGEIFTLYTMTMYFDNISWKDIYDNCIYKYTSNLRYINNKNTFESMSKYTIEELYCDNKILDFI